MPLARLLATRINQFSEICGTDEPWRFLSAKTKCPTWQLLRRRPTPGLGIAQAKVFRSYALKWNVGLAKFGQQSKVCAVQDINLRSFSYDSDNAPPCESTVVGVSREIRCKPAGWLDINTSALMLTTGPSSKQARLSGGASS